MSGHTPGPWFIDKNGVYALDETNRVNRFSARIDGGYVVYSTHTHIPRVRTSQAEIEANARLIASAPDLKADNDRLRAVNAELLEALEWMVANDETNEGDEWDEINAYWIDGLNRARAAIAKAKGDDHA